MQTPDVLVADHDADFADRVHAAVLLGEGLTALQVVAGGTSRRSCRPSWPRAAARPRTGRTRRPAPAPRGVRLAHGDVRSAAAACSRRELAAARYVCDAEVERALRIVASEDHDLDLPANIRNPLNALLDQWGLLRDLLRRYIRGTPRLGTAAAGAA